MTKTTTAAAITVAAMPPIQLLIPACTSAEHRGDRYTWFHGFCLLTVRPTNSTVRASSSGCGVTSGSSAGTGT